MAFTSVTALQALVNQSLGQSDTPAAQQTVTIGGLVLQGVLGASLDRLLPHVDVPALDAALTKTLEGVTELERVLTAPPASQAPVEAANPADLNQPAI